MRKLLFLFSILIFGTVLHSEGQQITLNMDTKPVGSVIRISKYVGDMLVPFDSLRYRGEQSVQFNYDDRYTDGVYAISIASLETFQFVLRDKEPITASIYESGRGMAFKPEESKENDAFNILLNLADGYSASMDSLAFVSSRLSDFDPRQRTVSDSLEDVYHRVAKGYNKSLDVLEGLFPESYVVEVLVPLDRIPLRSDKPEYMERYDNDAAFNHRHFFDHIDFSDERIITNPFLTSKVMEYLYNYSERSEQGIRNTTDMLLSMPDVHPKVQGFLVDLLVDFFTEKKAMNFVDHINRNYLGNCDLPMPEETLAKIRAAVKFNPDEVVPDPQLPTVDGSVRPLRQVQGDLKVMVFWASWCGHCTREIPKLQQLYQQMNGKLGVYAVSVDTSRTDWMDAIREFRLDWTNVNDLKGWDSGVLETFGVTSTPTLILLDSQDRFIGRASSFNGLQDLVSDALNE